MTITVQKQVTQKQEMEISLPAYYKKFGIYRMITESADVITVGNEFVGVTRTTGMGYDREVDETIGYEPCSKGEFEEKRDRALEAIQRLAGIESILF